MNYIKSAYERLPFQTKVMTLTTLLIFSIFVALSFYIHSIMAQTIETEIGEKALAVSSTIAQSSEIVDAFDAEDPSALIQPLTKSIQEEIGAEYIVVGNKDEIRYAHVLEDRIGKKMVGDDNERALQEGKSYISKKKGSLGLAVRGKSPIIQNGEVIGVVSVGYLLSDIKTMIFEKNKPIIFLFLCFLLIGMLGTVLIGRHLKKLLFQMEPHEIATSLLQKKAILQSAKEGIIAVDTDNKITLFNDSAKDILEMNISAEHEIIGKPLTDFTDIPLLEKAKDVDPNEDREFILEHDIVLMNMYSLVEKNIQYGAVATFRRKTELENVTRELSTIKQYTDGLRAQTHEFTNKLHTISGLLQLNHVEEALAFIREDHHQPLHPQTIEMETIEDPAIQALLIAKWHQANEKGIQLIVHQDSQLEKLPSPIYRDVMLKVIGNLIDNAYQAVNDAPAVSLFVTDIGKDIILEVDDNGPGIPVGNEETIFNDGYTTKKGPNHGTGLYIVKKAVTLLSGHVFLESGELGGARFIVTIPKEEPEDAKNKRYDY